MVRNFIFVLGYIATTVKHIIAYESVFRLGFVLGLLFQYAAQLLVSGSGYSTLFTTGQ